MSRHHPSTLRKLAAGVVSAALLLPGAPLAAQPQPQASTEAMIEARRGAARSSYEQGAEAYREQRYADAVQLFLQADRLAPSAALSFNVALAYERLDDTPAALRWYRDYLRRSPDAKNAQEVRARVALLAAKLAQRGVQQLSVFSSPAGAGVLIDNRNLGVTPLTLELRPGRHRVLLRLLGHRDRELDVTLEARVPQDVSLRLERAAAQPQRAGGAPAGALAATASKQQRFGVWPWVVMGAGAASLGGALGFELTRRAEESEAEESRSQLEFKEHVDDMQSQKTTARVLAGLGGALVVTGGVLLIFNAKPTPSTQLGLGCSGSGCRLAASGSFE